MTQPISGLTRETSVDFDGPPPAPTGPPPAPWADSPSDPEAGDAPPGRDGPPLRLPVTSDVREAAVSADAVATRFNAFLATAKPTFHTAEGDVSVPIAFRMSGGYAGHEGLVAANAATLTYAGLHAGMKPGEVALVKAGRATPQQVAVITQQLIDEGRLPPVASNGSTQLSQRVRQLMFDFGIGLDCAGYVQQASLSARGLTRASAGLRPPMVENLSALRAPDYQKVTGSPPQAGDFLILAPPRGAGPGAVGHTAVVVDVHAATTEELNDLVARAALLRPQAADGPWTAVVLDSSWGCSGDPQRGGVDRRTFFNDGKGLWAWIDERTPASGPEPYGHPITGFFRPAAK